MVKANHFFVKYKESIIA